MMVDDQVGGVDTDRFGDLGQPVEVAFLLTREHREKLAAIEARTIRDHGQRHALLLGQSVKVLGHELVYRSALHGARAYSTAHGRGPAAVGDAPGQ